MGNPEKQGGSRSVFVRCSDDRVYNVKFKENDQAGKGVYVLINELVTAGLAQLLELPTPEVALVQVTETFLDANQFLKTIHQKAVTVGLHFGSHRIGGVENTAVAGHLRKCNNQSSFPGFFVFDICTNNTDRKMDHCLVVKPDFHPQGYYVSSVDHGHCFGGPDWGADLDSKIGNWSRSHIPEMAELIHGDTSFTTWLERLHAISDAQINDVLDNIPDEWILSPEDKAGLKRFILGQRDKVAEILEQNRSLFPNWKGGTSP